MPEEIWLMIILIIGWATAIAIEVQCTKWHKKHDKAVSVWSTECSRKDKLIEKLENELKTYKDMERVIKIEKVTIQPRELECKFAMHERFIEESDIFKRVCLQEVARYMAEELEKDPYLYKMYFEQNPMNFHEWVKIKFRLLPYPEEAISFEEIKERLR